LLKIILNGFNQNMKIKPHSVLVLALTTLSLVANHSLISAQSSRQRSICTATLIADSPSARINLRSGAGTNYKNQGYGLVGDFVYILSNSPPEADYREDSQGYIWYRVEFPKSKAMGWIRQDFLRLKCAYD